MRIMRVVQYFQPKFGYADYYLMNEFKKEGHEVCIVTSDQYSPEMTDFDSSINRKTGIGKSVEYGLNTYRLPTLLEMGESMANLTNITYIKKVLEDFKPAVVHSNDLFYQLTILAAHYKRRFRYKLFVDSVTGLFEPFGIRNLEFSMFKWLTANYLRKNVDGFFAICEGSRKWLAKNFGVPYRSIKFVPLGADKELFAPSLVQRQAMRAKLGLDENETVLVFVGRIVDNKDLHVLVRAISHVVSKSQASLRLLLVGNGPEDYKNYLMSLAKKAKVQHLMTVVPPVPRTALSSYYNAADVAVWPGGPAISMIDAMATGLPIIICRYHALREDYCDTTHLIEYNNGLSFIRGNFIELASCIEKSSSDERLRKEMGRMSRKLVEDKLNWETIMNQYLHVYESILRVPY